MAPMPRLRGIEWVWLVLVWLSVTLLVIGTVATVLHVWPLDVICGLFAGVTGIAAVVAAFRAWW